jgi:4-deoxy-L-threo-5-hexosulose-uronate ketol-isomerase
MHHLADAHRTRQLSTSELRSNFLVDGLFRLGEVTLRHVDLDRVVLGGAVPLGDPLLLDAPASLAAEYFAERREIGILNIAARGTITVDGHRYAMDCQDVLYVSRGSKEIMFESDDAARPARFYIVSYPAHASHPTTRVGRAAAAASDLGTP